MLCEECRTREAVFTVNVLVDDNNIRRHLCMECMEKMRQPGAFPTTMQSLLKSIISAITGQSGEEPPAEELDTEKPEEPDTSPACPVCGTTLHRFEQTGRLGCPGCYDTFRTTLQPMLLQMHGRMQHAGRQLLTTPQAQAGRARQEELTRQMEQAVATEDFETAARLRDEIRALAGAKEEEA